MTTFDYFRNTPADRTISAGEMLYKVGEPDNVMYFIKEGEVDLLFNGIVLETVGKGGILGEKSLIDEHPHSMTAIAKTDVDLVQVDEKKFLFLVHETPMFALQVMRTLARRTREVMQLALK